jgi:hypothetical protein
LLRLSQSAGDKFYTNTGTVAWTIKKWHSAATGQEWSQYLYSHEELEKYSLNKITVELSLQTEESVYMVSSKFLDSGVNHRQITMDCQQGEVVMQVATEFLASPKRQVSFAQFQRDKWNATTHVAAEAWSWVYDLTSNLDALSTLFIAARDSPRSHLLTFGLTLLVSSFVQPRCKSLQALEVLPC